ncbi:hypothetical protein YPPY13_0328, partial [Yersinia pestis PY-13]
MARRRSACIEGE